MDILDCINSYFMLSVDTADCLIDGKIMKSNGDGRHDDTDNEYCDVELEDFGRNLLLSWNFIFIFEQIHCKI